MDETNLSRTKNSSYLLLLKNKTDNIIEQSLTLTEIPSIQGQNCLKVRAVAGEELRNDIIAVSDRG